MNKSWWAKYFEKLTQVQAEELNNIWISTELKESLGENLWTQNLTLTNGTVTAASQETQDLIREVVRDQLFQTLLAGCSLVESSLIEPSLAELHSLE